MSIKKVQQWKIERESHIKRRIKLDSNTIATAICELAEAIAKATEG